jgi:poly(A) polymerase
VKPLFRRAFVIGRRFRLVHVMIGQDTVEVSTYRAAHPVVADGQQAGVLDEGGRLLRDNVFGNQEEDARRRDFTVNALFYDPAGEELIDYHGGLADLKKRVLRMIGDPETRYREDPVRMLRAVRLAGKLGCRSIRRPARRSAASPSFSSRSRRRGCSMKCSSCCSPGTRVPACGSCATKACTRACCRCST